MAGQLQIFVFPKKENIFGHSGQHGSCWQSQMVLCIQKEHIFGHSGHDGYDVYVIVQTINITSVVFSLKSGSVK